MAQSSSDEYENYSMPRQGLDQSEDSDSSVGQQDSVNNSMQDDDSNVSPTTDSSSDEFEFTRAQLTAMARPSRQKDLRLNHRERRELQDHIDAKSTKEFRAVKSARKKKSRPKSSAKTRTTNSAKIAALQAKLRKDPTDEESAAMLKLLKYSEFTPETLMELQKRRNFERKRVNRLVKELNAARRSLRAIEAEISRQVKLVNE